MIHLGKKKKKLKEKTKQNSKLLLAALLHGRCCMGAEEQAVLY